MAEFKFEITERIGVLSENAKGWTKELNKVSWNEREPKYDLREWNPDHSRMGKGITLTDEEVETLKAILNGEEIEDDINEADIL
ncbi:YdbC family protein [Ruminococcus sp.]|uniref:YdbC family protein n=1 Tax=Ruminococcus sp. TaxID=41978 RepID=UPI002E78A43A|nr:YdbC family protein [Ruminococcus sp.]MEE0470520.1 YdbC family protein [Ruminococcus sp.]